MPDHHNLSVQPGTIKISWSLLELHVAPKLGTLTSPLVPPLNQPTANFGSWFLNNVFIAEISNVQIRILTSVFINRTEHACAAYEQARHKLADYLERLGQTNAHFSVYREALWQLETCILHANIALCSLKALLLMVGGPTLFVENDNSQYDRLRKVNNRIKHFDEDVVKGTCQNVVPAWLTNEGIECSSCAVSYFELVEMLNEASVKAKYFSETLFDKIVERRDAATAEAVASKLPR